MKLFEADYYRMTGRRNRFCIKDLCLFLAQHNIRYMYVWRKYQQSPNVFLRYILLRFARKYGLEISREAQIGGGLYLGHPYNITVAPNTVIGSNVNLHKGVTIGRENRGERCGSPIIGNQVFVGINATIVGHVVIGDDVLIAPNAFVNFDVPSHSIVVGNPAVIHPRDNATERYVAYTVNELT